MRQFWNNNTMWFLYDESGNPTGFKLNNAYYYYITNLQGDITAITDANGNIVAKYTYDEWGKILSITDGNGNDVSANEYHVANINPLRYRGYYYDSETGFYYLLTRYYDPVTRRFINADGIVSGSGDSVQGYNLFAYCFDNPVNMTDESGSWPSFNDVKNEFKKAVKWVAKNVVKPVVKAVENTLSKIDLTYSIGFNVSGTPSAWIFNGQIGVSMDTKGNVAIQASGGWGITGGNPGISITRYKSVTNAPKIDKLNDAYYQVGGSIAAPIEGVYVAAGGDVVFMPDSELNTGYFGSTENLGFGTPGKELHVEWGTTDTLRNTQFNIYDVARSVYIKIMEW